ncbi:MAG: helix-turn-helix domain-containing protein [Candidatus Thiodiazotropha lotti]|nr:helix-turn-helix domain-containing protein [Candidatus Thiodiazotropha lotti]
MNSIVNIESIAQVHEALGLEPPQHPLVSVLPIDERMVNYDYRDKTYVFGFYQVSFKSGIKGTITYGRNTYDFQEGTLVFSKPGQALQFRDKESTDGEVGWVLFFHPDLIRRSELGRTIDSYSYFSYEVHEALHVSEVEKRILNELVQKIERELTHAIDRHTQKLIISNIELLLDYCTRYYDRQFYVRTNMNQDLITRFEVLLHNYYVEDRAANEGVPTVRFCGEQLNMSASYLSDLLKKETGSNAQQLIQKFIIERAKTQLLNSSDHISQIAYGLGFDYPQHFSKLFKSKTGMSPAEYRKRN